LTIFHEQNFAKFKQKNEDSPSFAHEKWLKKENFAYSK
jgi:hypothetical protein